MASTAGWLSVQEAADACGVTYRTVYRMVRRGELPAEKPDRRPYRIRQADLEAFIERSQVAPGEWAHLRRPSRARGPGT
jgi:excisionase family DNA binding protein